MLGSVITIVAAAIIGFMLIIVKRNNRKDK